LEYEATQIHIFLQDQWGSPLQCKLVTVISEARLHSFE
jgi:hypothetical protein